MHFFFDAISTIDAFHITFLSSLSLSSFRFIFTFRHFHAETFLSLSAADSFVSPLIDAFTGRRFSSLSFQDTALAIDYYAISRDNISQIVTTCR